MEFENIWKEYERELSSFVLSRPLNTAKSQLFRAKKALAERFFSCCTYERNARGEVVDFFGCDGGC